MKNKTYLLIALLLGLVVGLSVSLLRPQVPQLAGQTNFSGPVNSETGYQESGTEIIDTSGAYTGVVSSTAAIRASTIRIGGTTSSVINTIDCVVATVDFPAVTTSTPIATTTAATGFQKTDLIWGSLSTSTQTAVLVVGGASTTETARATLFIPDGDSTESLDLPSADLTICWMNPA